MADLPLTAFDIIVVAVIALSVLMGLARGMIREIVVTGAGIFLVALIVFKILGAMLAGGVEAIGLGFVDRLGGLAFGLARGAFLVCAGYLIATMLMRPEEMPVWVKEGRLRPQVAEGAAWLRGFLPETIEADTRRAGEAMGRSLGLERGSPESPGGTGGTGAPAGEPSYPPETRQRLDRLMERVN
jgi:uncharacterized membrane protein required for colicin V production